MKKVTAILLMLSIILSMAGCQSAQTDGTTETTQSTAAITATTETTQPTQAETIPATTQTVPPETETVNASVSSDDYVFTVLEAYREGRTVTIFARPPICT